MKKISLALCSIVLAAVSAQAQIRWDFTDGDAVADMTIPNLANAPTLTRNNGGAAALIGNTVPSTGYAGASGGNNANAAAASGAFNVTTSTYFEFTLTPNAGFAVNVTGFELGTRATPSGPTTITLRSSSDSFVADIGILMQAADSTWRLLTTPAFNITGDVGAPLTLRFYGTGGTSAAAGNWKVDDISVTATTVIPEPATYMLLGIGALVCAQQFRRRQQS